MHISLKKQIHVTKIAKNIKTVDIVLFFAIFDLPQKNRQLIKNGISILEYSKIKMLPQHSSFSKNENFNLTNNVLLPVNLTPDCAMQPPFYNLGVKDLDQHCYIFAKNNILHIYNKSMQHISICSDLPFSGQTYMFAVKHEEHAHYMFTSAKSLYKGIFLGGFYKNIYKNNKDLKALCIAISQKKNRYTNFLKISVTVLKMLCIVSQICYKLFIYLLYKISIKKKAKIATLKISPKRF